MGVEADLSCLFIRTSSVCCVLLLCACAAHAPRAATPVASSAVHSSSYENAPPPPTQEDPVAAQDKTAQPKASAIPSPPEVGSQSNPAASTLGNEESDYQALYDSPGSGGASGNPVDDSRNIKDPWERYNRKVSRFNNVVDKYIAHPLATTYVKVVPGVVRLGVTNFFDNLGSPITIVNQLLEGHPIHSVQMLGRLILNSTIGLAGILDPASAAHIPRYRADFGQTLAIWGWRTSRYFVVPFFGPRTLRDTLGMIGDAPLSPLHYYRHDRERFILQGLQLVNTRAQLLPLDDIRQNAIDEYTLTRDAWIQQRDYQIEKNHSWHPRHHRKEDLPDYLQHNQEQWTVPMNAIPVPIEHIH